MRRVGGIGPGSKYGREPAARTSSKRAKYANLGLICRLGHKEVVAVREIKTRHVDGQARRMGAELARGGVIAVAALEPWSGPNRLQLGSETAEDNRDRPDRRSIGLACPRTDNRELARQGTRRPYRAHEVASRLRVRVRSIRSYQPQAWRARPPSLRHAASPSTRHRRWAVERVELLVWEFSHSELRVCGRADAWVISIRSIGGRRGGIGWANATEAADAPAARTVIQHLDNIPS